MSRKKKKNLLPEEFGKTYKDDEKLVFHSVLPFSSIKDPREIIACATHYNNFNCLVVNATGTAYVICSDTSHNLVKLYEYYLEGNPNNVGTISEVKKNNIPIHHIRKIEELPIWIKKEAPDEIMEKIERVLKK